MSTLKLRMTLAVSALMLLGVAAVMPRGIDAARLIAAAEDPEKLTALGLEHHFDAAAAEREIQAALATDDAELAESFLALADERSLPVAPALRAKVEEATGVTATALRATGKFIDGFVVGAPDDLAGVAGMVAGDLFVYGDIRDLVRETGNLVRGEKADELILGLACVGLAVTAGTYASLGAGAPARVGVSVIKAAGKTGRISARLAEAVMRPLRSAVDTAALKGAFGPYALLQPALAVRSARAAVKIEKAEGVMRVLGDVGKVQGKAGMRAALEGLRLAESPRDLTKLARLAEAKGSKTRAVLKVLGRGAIALTVGLFELSSWVLWALLTLIGLAASFKRLVERSTLRFIHWRKRVHLRRLAMAALPG
jgi:hypothetical protein